MTEPKRRKYAKLSDEKWVEAAEMHKLGFTQEQIAEALGVSERTVTTHLPVAVAKLDAAKIAIASTDKAPALPVPSPHDLPPVTDLEECGRYARRQMWSDIDAVTKALRREVASPVPNGRSIRALATAAEAFKNVWGIARDVIQLDDTIDDKALPQIIVREITADEVQEMRRKQRLEDGDIDEAEARLLKEETADDEAEEKRAVISEE